MTLDPAMLQEVEERATAKLYELAEAMVDQLLDAQGRTYGEEGLSDYEFLGWYLDKQQRGVLQALAVLPGPGGTGGWLRQYTRRFEKITGERAFGGK